MNNSNSAEGGISGERKILDPCTIAIFGASGDLTARKLIPALYHLFKEKLMPASFRVVGFARREKNDESWRTELRTALDQFSRTKPVDDVVWTAFAANLFYCQGDLTDAAAYQKMEVLLTSFGSKPLRENLLFYLAISPSQFGEVVEQVRTAGAELYVCSVNEQIKMLLELTSMDKVFEIYSSAEELEKKLSQKAV